MEGHGRLDLEGLSEDKINLLTTEKRVQGTLEITNVQATQRLVQGQEKTLPLLYGVRQTSHPAASRY